MMQPQNEGQVIQQKAAEAMGQMMMNLIGAQTRAETLSGQNIQLQTKIKELEGQVMSLQKQLLEPPATAVT